MYNTQIGVHVCLVTAAPLLNLSKKRACLVEKSVKPLVLKIIIVTLCVIALIGFFIPAIYVELSFLGNTRTSGFSLATVFEDNESQFGGMDFAQSDLADRFVDDDIMADVTSRITLSVALYFITLALTLCVLVLSLLGRMPKVTAVLLACAVTLYIVAGRTILTVPAILLEGIQNALGFFALFINISEMIAITLGTGYWLTLIVLAIATLTKIIGIFLTKL